MSLPVGTLLAASCLLSGCANLQAMNPINWWHQQEGGKIAQERPAPPGADQPYPNMATVPAKPDAPNQDDLKKLTDSLVADRTNAQHAAQAAPLADPSSPTASPGLFGVGTAPPPPPPGATPSPPPPGATPAPSAAASAPAPVASASMPAVTAPPAPPAPAPRKAVQSAPLDAPAASPSPTPAAATTPPPPTPTVVAAVQQPDLPATPPPRPAIAGPPPAEPVEPPPMPTPPTKASATIVFVEKASTLSPPAADEVKAFAARRGNATISVIGFGESTSSDPAAQSAALNLGLSRAQSIMEALKADGVPGNAIRVSAEASGRGASLQLLQ